MFKTMSGESGTVAREGSSDVQSRALMLQQQGCRLCHLDANTAYCLVTLLVNHDIGIILHILFSAKFLRGQTIPFI